MVTTIELNTNTFSERIIFVHLITSKMKTAVYQTKFKKHSINENCSTHFHVQLSSSVYNTRKNCKQFVWQS